jgi:hypothetical protein
MENYMFKYRTFDELMAEVQSDFNKYHVEDYIEPQQFIKVAKRVNYDLGLRIFKTKEAVIEIENGRGKLPNDFYVINFAFVLGKYKTITPVIQGTHTETIPFTPIYNPGNININTCSDQTTDAEPCCNNCSSPISTCGCSNTCGVYLNCKGQAMQLVQKIKYETREYTEFFRVKVVGDSKMIDLDCPNKRWLSKNTVTIKDNFIYSSFQTGKLYVNYQGMMEDEEGNLLVPDHDLLNEYYEYACKERLLENLLANDVPINGQLAQRIDAKLRFARNNARSFVSMPNFNELKKIHEVNRKAQYHKYYNYFV